MTHRLYDGGTKSGLESLARDVYWVTADQTATYPALDDPTYVKALATAKEWYQRGLDDAEIHDLLVALAAERNVIEDAVIVPLSTPPPARIVGLDNASSKMSKRVNIGGELRAFAKACGIAVQGETP